MTGKDRMILQKILGYIQEVTMYVADYDLTLFMQDRKTMSACAFSVSQIGELAKEISEATQDKYHYIPWKSIRGMRNKIVRDYENIDLSVLWGTIIKSLPLLRKQIEEIMKEQTETIDVLADD